MARVVFADDEAPSGNVEADYPPATRWNIWDLKAKPATIRAAAEGWRSLGGGVETAASTLTTEAGKITDWQGDAADTYGAHRGKLTKDLDGVDGLAGKAANTLDGIAGGLENIQHSLTAALGKVTCTYTVEDTSVTFYPKSAADVKSIDTAISDAEGARSDLDTYLSEAVGKFQRLRGEINDVHSAWKAAAHGTPTFDLPPESAGPGGGPEVIRDGNRVIVNTGAGDDQVSVTVDPKTGQRYLTVNGEKYAAPPGTQLTVRGGRGHDTISVPKGSKVNLTVLGSDGNDTVTGDTGSQTVVAGRGRDTVSTGDGNDRVYAGAGDDNVDLGAGNDVAVTGAGNDVARAGGGQDRVRAGAGDDRVTGGAGGDQLHSGTGADKVSGGAGNDHLSTGAGNDVADGGDNNDTVTTGAGDDFAAGGAGRDVIDTGAGGDYAMGGEGDDTINTGGGDDHVNELFGVDSGGEGNDTINGGDGDDLIRGGAGDDVVAPSAGNDTVHAGVGADTVHGGSGTNTIDGGDGADVLTGGAGDDKVHGGAGADTLTGGDGNDRLYGGEGNDVADGGEGDDYVDGGTGDDTLRGRDGDDVIYGGDGADKVDGGAGADYLEGSSGEDTLRGGAGNDTLSGGRDNDTILGETGDDTIYTGHGHDHVQGGAGNDKAYAQKETGLEKIFGDDHSDAVEGVETVVDVEYDPDLGADIKIEGSPEFQARVRADLEMLRSSPRGQAMLRAQDDLIDGGLFGIGGSSLTITETTDENGYAIPGEDREIQYNPAFSLRGIGDGHHSPPAAVLFHEMAHTYDFANGSWVDGTYNGPDNPGVNNGEREAVGLPIDNDGDGDIDDPRDFEDHPYDLTENGLLEEMRRPLRQRY